MTAFRTWFEGRTLREKRLLLAMLGLAAVVILWAGIILPVQDGLASARERHTDAVIRVGDTESRLAAVTVAERTRTPPMIGAFDAGVRASAEQAGFTLAMLNSLGPDRVQTAVSSARPAALFSWIATLEQSGILVETVTIANNGDQTVSAQMTLERRAT